jgi:hypothetical protein
VPRNTIISEDRDPLGAGRIVAVSAATGGALGLANGIVLAIQLSTISYLPFWFAFLVLLGAAAGSVAGLAATLARLLSTGADGTRSVVLPAVVQGVVFGLFWAGLSSMYEPSVQPTMYLISAIATVLLAGEAFLVLRPISS